jgi:hypothetical protein
MYTEKKNSKLEKKLQIKDLAQIATEKIHENKLLLETLSFYKQKIEIIKSFMNRKNNNENSEIKTTANSTEIKSNIDDPNINESIKKEFTEYNEEMKKFKTNLNESIKKLLVKYETNNNIAFDESSLQNINLQKYRNDNFILFYDLRPKNDIIKKLNENILNSRRYSVFRETKRESYVTPVNSEPQINNDNLYLQRDLQIECKHCNKCINKLKKKMKTLKKIKEKEEYLQKVIDYFEKENNISLEKKESSIFKKKKENNANNFLSFSSNKKKVVNNKRKNNMNNNNYNSITIDELGKKYQFEEDFNDLGGGYNDDQTYMANKGGINNLLFSNDNETKNKIEKKKEKEKEVKKKFNFLTVDELFDLENDEGEKEVIIQDELHSDDEVVFEKKIKNKVRISTMYLSEIKKTVPNLYLNQIEFNKKKIMNEADLYSYQRREYFKQNVDENIRLMKKRIKKLKKRLSINKQKLQALIEFDKKAKEKYKVLKPLKVQSSLKDYNISFMRREFYNFKNKRNDIIAEVDEKNYENEEKKNDDSEEEGDVDDYSDEMRKKKKFNKNNIVATEANDEDDKQNNIGNYYDYDYDKPKSK